MDLEIIETIFTFGKFAALTPSSMNNHNPHCLQKLYELCVFVVYVVSFILSAFVYRTQYAILTPIQLVLAILFQLNYIFYVFYVVVLVMRLRRSNFFRLIEGLDVTKARRQLHPKKMEKILKKIKFSIVALKKSVNIFNDTFGWTILFNIFSSASKTLVYIDVMIKQLDMLVTKSISLFYYDVCYILTTWIGTLSTILLCDYILKKYDEILAEAYRLETMLSSYEKKEIQVFIDVVTYNRPKFKAARFFSVDRSTLFSVLNSLTTFLLVMIQFKEI
ncbi:uncharacterized protein [Tenebrio molitor]|uniref:uncharacterized protein n=1 Tax=Tenebrio molitor TaxID=7067 RepID=UPI0036246D66